MQASHLDGVVGTGEFLTDWLVSPIQEVPFEGKKVPMPFQNYSPGCSVKDENGKEIVSPPKAEYVARGDFRASGYPSGVAVDRLYHPFDTNRVDFSGVWTFPAGITFYARTDVVLEQPVRQPVELFASGALKVWVNGVQAAEFYRYETNSEGSMQTVLDLPAGRSEIMVGCNDYGERNIVLKFGLKNLGAPLSVSLPIAADVEKIVRVNSALQSLSLDRLSYRAGIIVLYAEHPFEDDAELQIRAGGLSRSFPVKAGQKDIPLWDASELPIGYQCFEICTTVDTVELHTSRWAEIYTEVPSPAPASYEERAKEIVQFARRRLSPSLDSYIAALSEGENPADEFSSVLEREFDHIRRRGDCADFRMQRLMWILKKFRSRLTEQQAAQMEDLVLNFRYWYDEPGNDAMWFFSENHALSFHSSEMVAGEMFPDTVFPNSGLTGRQHAAKAKKLITEWFEKLLRYGYNEWNSVAYISVDMFSYITLFELCADAEVHALAQRALDMTFSLFAENSFYGVLGTSNGRTYPRDLLAARCLATNSMLWLAWGCACLNQHIDPALQIAISGYRPPENLAHIANWNRSEKYVAQRKEGTLRVPTVLCKTKDYILGTCISPRTGYLGSQEHLLNIFLQDSEMRIWINHPGEGKVFGERRPGYFSGNGLTPLVTQKGNIAVMSYRFPQALLDRAEVPYTHVLCDTLQCDEALAEDHWLFVRRGSAYAGIYSTNGLRASDRTLLKGFEFISPGINGTWFVKVSCEAEIGSFEQFTAYLRAHTPVFGETVQYTDYEYGHVEFTLLEEEYLRKVLNTPAAQVIGLRDL